MGFMGLGMTAPVAGSKIIGQNIFFSGHDGQAIFTDASIAIDQGEVVGVTGANGVGKSTLLRILAGQLRPLKGTIHISEKFGYFSQSLADQYRTLIDLFPERTRKTFSAYKRIMRGSEAIKDYEELEDRWDIEDSLKVKLQDIGIEKPLDTPLKELSGGQQTLVRLVATFERESGEPILLDEPTNNLDGVGKAWLIHRVSSWKGALLIVSHDRELLENADRIVEISNLGLRNFSGPYSSYLENVQIMDQSAQRNFQQAKKTKKNLLRASKEKAEQLQQRASKGRSNAKATGMSKIERNAKKQNSQESSGKKVTQMQMQLSEASDAAQKASSQLKISLDLNFSLDSTANPTDKVIIKVENLGFQFENGSEPFHSGLSFELRGNQRLQIAGRNGSGKSTLLKLLTKKLEAQTGSAEILAARFEFLDQKVEILTAEKSILENYQHFNFDQTETDTRNRLAQFLFRGESVFKKVADLSGGERVRAALAVLLSSNAPPSLLILDEPSNNIDLQSKLQIEAILANYQGALVVVSHDQEFIKNIGIEKTLGMPAGLVE